MRSHNLSCTHLQEPAVNLAEWACMKLAGCLLIGHRLTQDLGFEVINKTEYPASNLGATLPLPSLACTHLLPTVSFQPAWPTLPSSFLSLPIPLPVLRLHSQAAVKAKNSNVSLMCLTHRKSVSTQQTRPHRSHTRCLAVPCGYRTYRWALLCPEKRVCEDIWENKSIHAPVSCMLSCRPEVPSRRTSTKDYPAHRRMRTRGRVINSGLTWIESSLYSSVLYSDLLFRVAPP